MEVPFRALMAGSASWLSSKRTKAKLWPLGAKTSARAPNFPKASLRAASSVHPKTRHGFLCTGLTEGDKSGRVEGQTPWLAIARDGESTRGGGDRRAFVFSSLDAARARAREERLHAENEPGRLPLRLPGIHLSCSSSSLLSLSRRTKSERASVHFYLFASRFVWGFQNQERKERNFCWGKWREIFLSGCAGGQWRMRTQQASSRGEQR